MDNNDKEVWIDRQEYERLRTLDEETSGGGTVGDVNTDATTSARPTPSANEVHGSRIGFFTMLTGIFAVISFIFPPAILVFLVLGFITLVKFFRSTANKGLKIGVGIVVAGCIIIASPFLLLIAMVIMWQIGCWTGLGSCTTA